MVIYKKVNVRKYVLMKLSLVQRCYLAKTVIQTSSYFAISRLEVTIFAMIGVKGCEFTMLCFYLECVTSYSWYLLHHVTVVVML